MANRGRPFQPGNQQGRGRPRGSRNKTTVLAQQLLQSHCEPIVRKALVMALNGDQAAMRLVMERLVPVQREAPIKIGRLPSGTAIEVSKSVQTVIDRAASGRITLGEAERLGALLEVRRRTIQTEELESRLGALESKS
jgi:hypothetical protein